MEQLSSKIKALASSFQEEIIAIRRHIHQYPELSFQEFETSAYIQKHLEDLNIPFDIMATTGVVGYIKGDLPGDKVYALRADIDALPITEVDGREYGSKNAGVMHACGHDVHSSSLIGVAKILSELKSEFGGTIKLIFQPGEERLPGGASLMIKDGVLENPKPKAIIGQHVLPFMETGYVGFRAGKYMASADELYLTVKGKGGHAAMPYQTIDPIVIIAQIITALQTVVSRSADPRIPSVLSWGKIEALGATNVIPSEVKAEGTFRTFDEKWRASAHEKMTKIVVGIAEAMGATCDFEIKKGYPFLVNEEKVTNATRQFAEEYLGKDKVLDLELWTAAEDFAYYSQVTDACFYRLGTGNQAKGINSGVHTSTFDVDEKALELSIGLMSYIALKHLDS